MKKHIPLLLVLAVGVVALAADKVPHVLQPPTAMKWTAGPPSLPPGTQVAMLEGDLAKEGFFAVRLKLPAGYRIPPHFHPVQERVTVIEGTFRLGMGDKVDEKGLRDYPAGSYLSMPAGMRHFAETTTGTVLQLATIGPWGITYVNPADDPRRQTMK